MRAWKQWRRVTLETERLQLRPFEERDLDGFAAMCADPEVMRYLGGVRDRAATWIWMVATLSRWTTGRSYDMWAVEERATGRFVGRVGLQRPEGRPGLELAWLLGREHQGRGFATEAGRAALDHAFDVLHADRVISLIDPANTASIRLAKRLGERFARNDAFDGREVAIYEIASAQRASQTRSIA